MWLYRKFSFAASTDPFAARPHSADGNDHVVTYKTCMRERTATFDSFIHYVNVITTGRVPR